MQGNRLFNRGLNALNVVIVIFLLISCGGGGNGYGSGGSGSGATTYTIGGNVVGLGTSKTVVLTELYLNKDVTISTNGPYAFPAATVANGALYNVSVKTQPALQTCTVMNASGTAGTTNITNVDVTCA